MPHFKAALPHPGLSEVAQTATASHSPRPRYSHHAKRSEASPRGGGLALPPGDPSPPARVEDEKALLPSPGWHTPCRPGTQAPLRYAQTPEIHSDQEVNRLTAPTTVEEVPRTPLNQAKRKYDEGSALFVDVRSPQEYEASHIPGAINI
ncbi:MAG: rhodanese-like domain-containing protein, partial [Sphingomonadaceae bacterium]